MPVHCDTSKNCFFLQLLGTSKVLLGFTSHEEAERWFDAVVFYLDDEGIFFKDDGRNQHMSDIFDASDTDVLV